ncbi:NAD-glutamate dehydrogenase [Pseudactinotalea sp. HY160]|uniref:NAD-glutamate dehydrogenase n=1 Tax=Pseudactinotalea sp. HY160 TaxID=2654490 RepID=UPI00128DB7A2|nr:NAD-glutamate dehydrogenase [Pseudactinotalea sp. HY160]MPV49071.1 NAD-glutamate dehydrogenase [Pseudactinotalea sp. HY160]
MSTDLAARRRALLAETERLDPGLHPLLEQVVAHVATEDLLDRSPAGLVGAAGSLRELAAHRRPGEALVHVFTPTVSEHGWTSRRTIVDICIDDAPFLVDSITAAVVALGCSLHLLVHPILDVERDAGGELVRVHPGPTEHTRSESWMHLEVSRLTTAAHHEEVGARMRAVLGDVHAAVTDWQAMRAACRDIVTGLRAGAPTTVPPETVEPTIDFLAWLANDHFTFLGYREYELTERDGEDVLVPVAGSGLGILHAESAAVVHLRPEARASARAARLLTITKANSRATVHRDAYLDYIGVRTFDAAGNVTGERRFLGLFTSTAYASSVTELPIVGAKVAEILARSHLSPTSHSGKDLHQVLENYPRDELFQDSLEHLAAVAGEVVLLTERRRPRVFLRPDEFGRFVSALVYLPRDRYTTTVRLAIEALLRQTFGSDAIDHTTKVSDAPLAQLHFVVRLPKGTPVPDVDEGALNDRLAAAIRTWQDRLVDHLQHTLDDDEAAAVLSRYGRAFPTAYTEFTDVAEAAADITRLASLERDSDVRLHLYAPAEGDPGSAAGEPEDGAAHPGGMRRFKMVTFREYPLTQVMPVLTALGVDVVDERPYRLTLADGTTRHISDFGLTLPAGADPQRPARWGGQEEATAFEEAFRATWTGTCENDTLNSLVLTAGLGWRDIVILRALGRYLRQGGTAFSMEYIEVALLANAALAAGIVALFHTRFDPDLGGDRESRRQREDELAADLHERLDDVASLDHDRILRSLVAIVQATWRTNFYRVDASGQRRPWLSAKIDCTRVPGLPKPHPMAEIWVYSPQLEGVHLRFGEVARGGLRWSDRREDFRTEVLGLVKAQMVKNAVIVPTGSKGGFVAKQLPPASDRAAWLAEGRSAYASFIRGLLDLTDNRVGDRVEPPDRVVRHDGDDPYLVVAADKGTASFSDLANEISRSYDYWLDDAFASGGSAGYDHKGMGITSRGAWESAKRHFRELDVDIQSEDVTVVGIGDMSGDVFGNGMLRSRHLRLVAAFDHRHVFLDPDPDPATGFAERERLFHLPRSSWDDYDRSLLSAGGGIHPRTAKSVPITPEVRTALGIADDVGELTPSELIRACLLAPVDLLYNGGIGTYVKARSETHAQIGDRLGDAVRVDGADLRARVVVEGGNLGVSQRGRIEAAQAGVRINTDAIDNSAGVGTSDKEVNLKIGFTELVRSGAMTLTERNDLLAAMTDEVATQVLRDNYEQNVLLGNSRVNAARMLPLHQRLIQSLEARGDLDRSLEFLPEDAEIATRIDHGRGLERPEFAVLMAYVKLALKEDLAATDMAADPWFAAALSSYFPSAVRERFAGHLADHPLRSRIIVNAVANSMINRGGVSFPYRAADETGAGPGEIARAFVAAREIFSLTEFTAAVEATDTVVATDVQTRLYLDFRRVLDRASRWFLHHRDRVRIGAEVEAFGPVLTELRPRIADFLRGRELAEYTDAVAAYRAAGADAELAEWGAGLLASVPLLDIAEAARAHGRPAATVARVYYALADRVGFADLLGKASSLPLGDRWTALARSALRDDLYGVMIALTVSVLAGGAIPADADADGDAVTAAIADWLEAGGVTSTRALESLEAIAAVDEPGIATVSVALRKLRSLTR